MVDELSGAFNHCPEVENLIMRLENLALAVAFGFAPANSGLAQQEFARIGDVRGAVFLSGARESSQDFTRPPVSLPVGESPSREVHLSTTEVPGLSLGVQREGGATGGSGGTIDLPSVLRGFGSMVLGGVGAVSISGFSEERKPGGESLAVTGTLSFAPNAFLSGILERAATEVGVASDGLGAGVLRLDSQVMALGRVSGAVTGELRLQDGQPLVIQGSLMLAPAPPKSRTGDTAGASRSPEDGTGGIIRLDPREWDGTFNSSGSGRVELPKPDSGAVSGVVSEVPERPVIARDSQTSVGGGGAAPRSSSAAGTGYQMSVLVPPMYVGAPVGYSMIVVLRPSPGDDYWYRQPHTIAVKGVLPDGVELIQKGTGFHELARFEGVPRKVGNYPVTLQATMADGQKTTEVSVVLEVRDSVGFNYAGVYVWGRKRFLSGENSQGASFVSIMTDRGGASALPEADGFELRVSGLPPGLRYDPGADAGNYILNGSTEAVGTYVVKYQWGSKDGPALAESESELEILPADYIPQKRVVLSYPGQSLKQAQSYEAGSYRTPMYYAEDDLGRRISSGLKFVAEGLPKGLQIGSQSNPSETELVGRPLENGLFTVRVKAVFEDGSESQPVNYDLQVDAALKLSDAAGSYDCLVGRLEDLNDNNGGRFVVTLGKKGSVSGFLLNNFRRYPFSSRNATVDSESRRVTIEPPGSGFIFNGSIEEDSQGYSTAERPVFVLSGTLTKSSAQSTQTGIYGTCSAPRAGVASVYASPNPVNLMVVPAAFDSGPREGSVGPSGVGFSALRISPGGMVLATVWAADGSAPVTCATRLCETASLGARFNVFFALNNTSGKSSLMGPLFVNESGDAAGQLEWYQNASNRGGFPEGIPLIQYEGVIGSRMIPQPSGLNLEGFEEGLRNAELDFMGADGDLEMVVAVTREANSAPSVMPSAAPSAGSPGEAVQSASGMKMRYNSKTGILTGSMVWTDEETGESRPVKFRGMRAPDGTELMGHFTVPEKQGGGKLEAGMIRVQPAQP